MKPLSGASIALLSFLRFEPLVTETALLKLSQLGIRITKTRAINILNTLQKNGLTSRASAGMNGRGRAKMLESKINDAGIEYIGKYLNSPIEPTLQSLEERLSAIDYDHDTEQLLSKITELESRIEIEIEACSVAISKSSGVMAVICYLRELELGALKEACATIKSSLEK